MKPYHEGLPEFARAVCEKYTPQQVRAFIQDLLLTSAIDDPFNPRNPRNRRVTLT